MRLDTHDLAKQLFELGLVNKKDYKNYKDSHYADGTPKPIKSKKEQTRKFVPDV